MFEDDIEEIDWGDYHPFFTKGEFDCKHTGENKMVKEFMDKLMFIRKLYGKPMVITSGYRHHTHPEESRKENPGYHSMGIACDIACWSDEAYYIVKLAFEAGFTGIGVSQSTRSGKRFIHLDLRSLPRIYSY